MKRVTVTKREVYDIDLDFDDFLIRLARWELPSGDLSLGDFGRFVDEEFLCVEIEDVEKEGDTA